MAITTTPVGGPQGALSTYTPIYSTTLSANTASVTFANIPSDYTDLEIKVVGKATASGRIVQVELNGDTSTSYSMTEFYESPNASPDPKSAARTDKAYYEATYAWVNFSESQPAICRTYIQNANNASTYKTFLSRVDSPSATYPGIAASVGVWRKTSPVTSVRVFSSDFASGTTLTLYGIKAAVTPPKATGGDVITTDGTYWYHAFKNSGVFNVKTALTADVLILAGGGAGGSGYYGGGGGAGGLRAFTAQSLSLVNYTVLVGAGGASGVVQQPGGNGSTTTFNSLSVTGGGGGGGYAVSATAPSGGSGGGGGGQGGTSSAGNFGGSGNAGSYSPVEGYLGGRGWNGPAQGAGGGGGGLSGGGGAAGNLAGGAGANGAAVYNTIDFSTWLTATGTGSSTKVAAGGGGGTYNGGSNGAAGTGGAGAGTLPGSNGGNATPNTGSGGGGAGDTGYVGGNGSAGLVIVRYPV